MNVTTYSFNYREQLFNCNDNVYQREDRVSEGQKVLVTLTANQIRLLGGRKCYRPRCSQGLKNYAIGEKLRGLRLKKKMGLVELGRHTGLSAALLSKVERGKLFPTLPTLLRIALVFSVGLEYFFTEDQRRQTVGIVRRNERKRFPERPEGGDVSFYFESLDFAAVERKLNAYHAEFQQLQPGKARTHHHARSRIRVRTARQTGDDHCRNRSRAGFGGFDLF